MSKRLYFTKPLASRFQGTPFKKQWPKREKLKKIVTATSNNP
jgi:hypothetical protein